MKRNKDVSQQIKSSTTSIWSVLLPRDLPKEHKSINPEKDLYDYIHCSYIYSNQDLKAIQMLTERWMDRNCGTYTQWNTTQL